jgi:hypothetical protein
MLIKCVEVLVVRGGWMLSLLLSTDVVIHGPKVAPSFYKLQKGRKEEQTLVPMVATAFQNTEIWHQWSPLVEQ